MVFLSKEKYKTMKMLLVLMSSILLFSCEENHQSANIPMQQTMDSLKMWYTQMEGDSMEAASRRIKIYLDQHQDDSTEPMRKLRAEWLKARGVYFSAIKGLPDSALTYTEQALTEMQGLKGMDEIRVLAMANRADFYRQLGQLDKSADAYLQALQTADATGVSDSLKIPLMLGISTAYTFMGDYSNSQRWWQRLGTMVPIMKRGDQFIYYNNLGNDFYFQAKYQEARDCFQKAAELVKGDADKQWDYYTAVANLGEIYIRLQQADTAQQMIQQADSFFRRVNFPPLIYYIATSHMEQKMLEGDIQGAQAIAASSPKDDISIPAAKVLRLKALERLMKKTGHWKNAMDIHDELHLLNDSIQTIQSSMRMSAQLLQYRHDKQLLEKQQEIDHQQMKNRLAWALLMVAILTVIVMVILYQLRRRRQRMQELATRQQIVVLRMENTRNRITPHFIYNALSHEMLEQMKGRAVDLNALTQLLRRGVEQADMLDTTLSEELRFVDYYVEIEGRQMGNKLCYHKEIANEVNPDNVHLPAMTIQIFVENAIKHGLQRQGGELTIRVGRQSDNTLIEVIDNGRGLGTSKPMEHTGMKVVRQTIQMLNEHNRQQITFGIANATPSGCRAWLLVPDDFNYSFTSDPSTLTLRKDE
jgi:tetratricopeptide (TPR) repeat protein